MTGRMWLAGMLAGLAAVAFLGFFVYIIVHATLSVLAIAGGF